MSLRPRRAALHLVLLTAALFTLAPVLVIVSTAVSKPGRGVSTQLIPVTFTLHNLTSVVGPTHLPRLFLNSAVVALASTLVVLVAGSFAAYGLVQHPFPGSRAVQVALLAGIMLAPASIIVPLYHTILRFRLVNDYFGLIGPYSAFGVPIAVLLFRNAFAALPHELAEAARVDGASTIHIYLRIFMPLARPTLATVAILQVLISWNDYLLALLVMTKTSMQTVQLAFVAFAAQFLSQYEKQFAVLAMITLPVIVVFVAFQRQFIRGLTGGAVKG
jgi:raffinose/stachyose/melibiose transport system permease protein